MTQQHFFRVAATATIAGFLAPSTALACGGFFCNNEPIEQSAEQIVFEVDSGKGTVTTHVQISYEGTAEAHAEGGVPNWTLTLPRLDAETVGRLLSFYMHAVAVSGTMLGVDPFNQPGVETYKKKMFSLLGNP